MGSDGLTPYPVFLQSLSPLLWPCANEEQVCVCPVSTMPLCCSRSQVITIWITSLSISNLYCGLHPSGLQIGGNQKLLDQGCRLDGVTLSNQILWWLSELPDLYVALQCHAEARFLLDSGDAKLIRNTSWAASGFWGRCRSWSSPTQHAIHKKVSVLHSPSRQLSWPCLLMESFNFVLFHRLPFLSPVQSDGPSFICCNSPW